jgi:hypothetical protein
MLKIRAFVCIIPGFFLSLQTIRLMSNNLKSKIMEDMVLILKTTQNDDSEGSVTKSVKLCKSVEAAKQAIIKELKDGFELPEDCDTYAKIANELAASDIQCRVQGNGMIDTIWWYDNGNGEQFDIIPFNSDDSYYII